MHRDTEGNVCSPRHGHTQFYVPCGQCGECRLSRARMWATRCVHESTMWKHSCFITLTYRENPGSLNPEDTKLFIERLRYHLNAPFKYLLVGEYGENFDRPHYHALIFGTDFGLSTTMDKRNSLSLKADESASNLEPLHNTTAYRSPDLDAIWGLGYTAVGHLTFDSAAYCAQYSMKKITGPNAAEHYKGRYPEFARRSQNAIGKQYALRYAQEIIDSNSVLSNSVEQPIPNYYLKLYEKQNFDLSKLKSTREEFSQTHSIAKSYIRACQLDSKFKLKISKADAFRIRYAKNKFFDS